MFLAEEIFWGCCIALGLKELEGLQGLEEGGEGVGEGGKKGGGSIMQTQTQAAIDAAVGAMDLSSVPFKDV